MRVHRNSILVNCFKILSQNQIVSNHKQTCKTFIRFWLKHGILKNSISSRYSMAYYSSVQVVVKDVHMNRHITPDFFNITLQINQLMFYHTDNTYRPLSLLLYFLPHSLFSSSLDLLLQLGTTHILDARTLQHSDSFKLIVIIIQKHYHFIYYFSFIISQQ